jgi:hypothetical protein
MSGAAFNLTGSLRARSAGDAVAGEDARDA